MQQQQQHGRPQAFESQFIRPLIIPLSAVFNVTDNTEIHKCRRLWEQYAVVHLQE